MWCKVPDAFVILLDLIVFPNVEGDVFKCFSLRSGGASLSSGFESSGAAVNCCLRRAIDGFCSCLPLLSLASIGLAVPTTEPLRAPRLLESSAAFLSSSSCLSLNAFIYEANLLFNYLPNNY